MPSIKTLVTVSWVLWWSLLALAVYGVVRIATDRSTSPEGGKGIGLLAVGTIILLLLVAGGLLLFAARRESRTGVVALLFVLSWPLVVLVAQPIVLSLKQRGAQQEADRTGDFASPAAARLGQAILSNDTATVASLLASQSVPTERDRAGHDLLTLAVFAMCDRNGGLTSIRLLLERGANARTARMPDGDAPVRALILSRYRAPQAPDAIRLLLDHGADPNGSPTTSTNTPLRSAADQPDVLQLLVERGADLDRLDEYGLPPVVHFTATRAWDAAIYLVERGARLDIRNEAGVSLDYYLNDWRESVYGEHPEGWDRLRAAIMARRQNAGSDR